MRLAACAAVFALLVAPCFADEIRKSCGVLSVKGGDHTFTIASAVNWMNEEKKPEFATANLFVSETAVGGRVEVAKIIVTMTPDELRQLNIQIDTMIEAIEDGGGKKKPSRAKAKK